MQVSDGNGGTDTQAISVTVNDLDEFDVGAVSDTDASANAVNENAANGTTVGITASASDADATTNAITYSLQNNDGGRFTIDASTGVVKVAGTIDREADGGSRNITVRATSADGSFTDQVFSIVINDLDEFDTGAVTDSDASANTVAENAAIGTAVGLTGLASDADATATITYSLDDNAGGRFAIHATTGVVTVNAALDYETATSHSVTIRATSSDGSYSTQSFSIAVTDVNESGITATSDTDGGSDYVLENAANSTAVGVNAFADDPDGTDTVSYALDDNAGGRFAIHATTGVVTVAGGINREAAGTYDITVRATSSDTSTTTRTFTITIGDVDEFDVTAPADSNGAANAVDENAANGSAVGITASASDADATTNTISYSLTDNAGGRFAIHSSTGVVTVANGSLLDREAAATHNITVRATSADGSTADSTFTIDLNDFDEFDTGALTDSNGAANTVAENAGVGTAVGLTGLASDADATATITYSLDDNAGGRFAIHATTGVVTVADGIDRETADSYDITVRATSSDTTTTTRTFTITIGDVDEFDATAPADTNGSTNAVDENAANGTPVGLTAAASDADATTNTITYSLTDDAGGRFAIHSSTGVVTVANGSLLDREAAAAHNITVRATSADGSFTDQAFSIAINDVDEFDTAAVSDTNGAANAVSENAVNGTTVGITAAASDADATTHTITYNLQDNDGGRFAIDENTGIVTLVGAIDREADGPSRNITVRATSADGSFTDHSFTIAINDVDEFDTGAVTELNAGANAVNENAVNGTAVGISAAASDSDATANTITYSLQDNAGGRFAIDANTGVVTAAGAIDREADGPTRNITVRATSADGSYTDQMFSIAINDVDEFDTGAVTDSNGAANTVAEDATVGTAVGLTGLASDPDATAAITYSLDDNAGGRFAIHTTTGVVTVNGALDYETATSHSVTVCATSSDGSYSTQIFSIAVTDINESVITAISDTDGESDYVLENSVNGTTAGLTAFADDPDGTDTVSYTLVDDAGGRFAIQVSTGIVTVAGPLDYESATRHEIVVRATSSDGSTVTCAMVIGVAPVNDNDPHAVADSYAIDEDTTLTVPAAGVLANDTDADADSLTARLIDGPSHGRLTLDSNGSFSYLPDDDFFGNDSFTYAADDGLRCSQATEVRITVADVSDVPLPVPGQVSSAEIAAVASAAAVSDAPVSPVGPPAGDVTNETPQNSGFMEETASKENAESAESVTKSPQNGHSSAQGGKVAVNPVAQNVADTTGIAPGEAGEDKDQTGPTVRGRATRSAAIGHARDASPSDTGHAWYATNDFQAKWLYGETPLPATAIAPDWEVLWERLDSAGGEVLSDARVQIVVSASTAVTTAVSVGYVVWTIRGTALVASLASSLPTWTLVDPLPILEQSKPGKDKKQSSADEDSLQAMIERTNRQLPPDLER